MQTVCAAAAPCNIQQHARCNVRQSCNVRDRTTLSLDVMRCYVGRPRLFGAVLDSKHMPCTKSTRTRRKLGTAQSGRPHSDSKRPSDRICRYGPPAEMVRTVCEVERRIAQPALRLPLRATYLPSQTAKRHSGCRFLAEKALRVLTARCCWGHDGAVPARSLPAPTSRASSRQAPGPTQDLACPTHSRTLACRTALRSAAEKPALRPWAVGPRLRTDACAAHAADGPANV